MREMEVERGGKRGERKKKKRKKKKEGDDWGRGELQGFHGGQ